MNEEKRYRERRRAKRKRLETLGLEPVCIICGEDDPFAFELDHIRGREFGDELWPLCMTHHAIVSSLQHLERHELGEAVARTRQPDPLARVAARLNQRARYFDLMAQADRADAGELIKLIESLSRSDIEG
jgi:hypothetical protein